MPLKEKNRTDEDAPGAPVSGSRGSRPERDWEDERSSGDRILDAAERLMAERGYAGTSISAITRDCGLPASSIYWHFSNKQGLLAAVMERAAERWLIQFRADSKQIALGDRTLGGMLARAAPEIGAPPTEFLRLLILLALERRDGDSETLETIRRVRLRALELIREAIFETFRSAGEGDAGRIADTCSVFVLTFGEGLFVGQQIDPGIDMNGLTRQLEQAVLALGREQLQSSSSKAGSARETGA